MIHMPYNLPILKVQFNFFLAILRYLQPSTVLEHFLIEFMMHLLESAYL